MIRSYQKYVRINPDCSINSRFTINLKHNLTDEKANDLRRLIDFYKIEDKIKSLDIQ